MNTWPTKPCKFCGSMGHFPYKCFKNPKNDHKQLRRKGRYGRQWDNDRATWFRNNPPDQYPYPHYVCYLPGHGEWLLPPKHLAGLDNPLTERVTLDHVLSRGRHPELRSAQANFKPACYAGNQEKGSKDGNV